MKKLPAEFWNFVTARFLYVLGTRMVTTIVIYQVFHLANTFMVGMAGLTEFIPAVLTALYAGHYIDTHDKKKVLVSAYALYALCALLLCAASRVNLLQGSLLPVILILVFCTGIIRSFAGPAGAAMIASIVQRQDLQRATSLNSTSYLLASVTGHASGGFLIALLGISNGYLVAGLLISVACCAALFLKPKLPAVRGVVESKIKSIQGGFSFVFNNKTLLGVISLDLFAVLFGGAVAFIPEICETVLHTGPKGYGFLNAAMDIGSLMSVFLLTILPMKRRQGLKMLLAVLGFGICIIIFGLSKIYWLSFAALLLAGFLDGISVVVRGTIMQLQTPDELRGRVSSINMIFINSSNELGQFESGFTSKLFGTVHAIIFGGIMSVLIVGFTWWKFPRLKKIEF